MLPTIHMIEVFNKKNHINIWHSHFFSHASPFHLLSGPMDIHPSLLQVSRSHAPELRHVKRRSTPEGHKIGRAPPASFATRTSQGGKQQHGTRMKIWKKTFRNMVNVANSRYSKSMIQEAHAWMRLESMVGTRTDLPPAGLSSQLRWQPPQELAALAGLVATFRKCSKEPAEQQDGKLAAQLR